MMQPDNITLKRIDLLHPKVREEAHAIYAEICGCLKGRAICRFSHTLRTIEEQNALYAKGRTTPGATVTKAKGGRSFHNYGLAIDIVLLKDTDANGTYETASWETNVDFDGDGKADWMEVVEVFEKHGWEWGGRWTDFPDRPHFQKTFGKSTADLLALYNAGRRDAQQYVIV